jgi:O-antigen biosynthesis protein
MSAPSRAPQPALSVVIPTFDNLAMLQSCLDGWRTHAAGQPVELLVVEDGCRDATPAYLTELLQTEWGARTVRVLHENDAHELVCTNRGFDAARAPLVATWQDDMFLRASWFVPELVRTFAEHPDIGMLALSRGLELHPLDEPIRTWEELVDWRRLRSTIGPPPLNWFRLQEVDGVVRPWVVRKACLGKVGGLDEAFRPTCWDETDLAFRIRGAGWRIAAFGYERLGAFVHVGSTTISKTPAERFRAGELRNGLIFHERWSDEVRRGSRRRRAVWPRRTTAAGWAATARSLAGRLLSAAAHPAAWRRR